MRIFTLSLAIATLFAGCNKIKIGDEEMAVTAQSVASEIVSTNVTDSTAVFNNTIRQNYPNGTKYKENYNIYMNTGDDINVTAYDLAASYIVGQIVYKDDLVKKCTAIEGEFVKQPEEYTAVDTSFDSSTWSNRYMKLTTIPDGVSLFGRNFSVSSIFYDPEGLFISPDGSKMYVSGASNNNEKLVYQFSITNGDVSTAVATGKYIIAPDLVMTLFFSPDGLNFYYSTLARKIVQYQLSTAWDITTATLLYSKAFVPSYVFRGLCFSSDGTKIFVNESSSDSNEIVRTFKLGTAWKLNTINTTPYKTIDITSIPVSRNIYGIALSNDGLKMFLSFYYGGAAPGYQSRVEEHTLSTAWDITTHTKTSEIVVSEGTYDIRVSADGTNFYEINAKYDKVYQRTLTTANDLSTATYSFIPFSHSETIGGSNYSWELLNSSGTYSFKSTKDSVSETFSPMTVYSELDESSVEDNAYFGTNGTWIAKTLIIRDNELYIRTLIDADQEYKTLTDYQFSTITSPTQLPNFNFISATNDYKPFDEYNITQAVSSSPMTYKISVASKFNAFSLVNVVATSLTYTIKDTTETVVKTGTLDIDCLLDDDGLLPQGGVTLMVCAETIVDGGGIEIELTNTRGDVKLGGFTPNIAVDEGITLFDIQTGVRDYNDYTPDAWGNIPEGVKAKTKTFTINVKVPYSKFDKTYRRHLSYLGKFVTVDGTDALKNVNSLTLYSLVAKGFITAISHKTEIKNGDIDRYYSYNMTFLETT